MNVLKKVFVGAFCVCSSLGMMASDVHAQYAIQPEVSGITAVFPEYEISESNQEQNTTELSAQSDTQPDGMPEVCADESSPIHAAESAGAESAQLLSEEAGEAADVLFDGEQTLAEAEAVEEDKEDVSINLLLGGENHEPASSIVTIMQAAVEQEEEPQAQMEEAQEEEAQEEEAQEIVNSNLITASIQPNFDNLEVWQNSESPYHQNRLWGQCTWFAWHRFYEIYGFNPGFRNNGYQCAEQLVASHPDKFELSSYPKAGAVFSYYNHTGIVIDVTEDGMMTIQDGNLDFVTNYVWTEAINDWRTYTISVSDFLAANGGVVFANPIYFEVVVQ